jgi:hypothetical protein
LFLLATFRLAKRLALVDEAAPTLLLPPPRWLAWCWCSTHRKNGRSVGVAFGDSTLYVFHRDKMTGKPTGNPKREVSLGGCLVKVCLFATKVEEKDNNPKKKAETEKTVMGKSLVLEIVSLSDGVAVMSFGSVLELERWATIVRDAANDSRVADSAFPGIRVIQVEEQADDESWRALLAPADG